MVNKDRVAIVVSILLVLVPWLDHNGVGAEMSLGFAIMLAIYWGYRFIKDDISL
ncbi:MAG: hypothetical protein ABGY11_13095 [Candidatus Thioglobus sp.]|jgi:hypothetical protein